MRIYFAGSDDVAMIPLYHNGALKRAFVSFFYVKEPSLRHVVHELKKSQTRVIMDSGAHTFFTDASMGATPYRKKDKKKSSGGVKKVVNPDYYMAMYRDYVKKHHDFCDHFVELDIGVIVGLKKQIKWLDDFAKDGLAHKIIPAFHPDHETMDQFFDRMKDWPSKYVAFEGFVKGTPRFDHVAGVRRFYEAGIRVHGFAMTKLVAMENIPFYSVDSTTFKAGVMWGKPVIVREPGRWALFDIVRPKDRSHKERMAALMLKNRVPLDMVFDLRVNKGKGNRSKTYIDTISHALMILDEVEEYYRKYWIARGVDWKTRLKEAGVVEENHGEKQI